MDSARGGRTETLSFSGGSNPDSTRELLAVARLTHPHGLRGEIAAIPLAPEVLRFDAEFVGKRFILRRSSGAPSAHRKELTLKTARPQNENWLLTFEEVADREAAMEYKGVELCLPRHELPVLPEGWYWEADIIGAEVCDLKFGVLGVAEGLHEVGGRWLLRVRRDHAAPIEIPWVKAMIRSVKSEPHRIETEIPLDFPGIE